MVLACFFLTTLLIHGHLALYSYVEFISLSQSWNVKSLTVTSKREVKNTNYQPRKEMVLQGRNVVILLLFEHPGL